ncbi:reverse transcriptase [Pochonia chlamydosporia 170]|uniref:Reverse transcriptase n=1 Tax=Pochonia chlamydosporia 170 TaxID=1380566 RepID=A0A179EY32_METCM|nr:reverse transcriptase [Pochonia chlamydosporia 170]OAQ58106.1 reverse transcriptase [Pochonia chlamydosporia 170]
MVRTRAQTHAGRDIHGDTSPRPKGSILTDITTPARKEPDCGRKGNKRKRQDDRQKSTSKRTKLRDSGQAPATDHERAIAEQQVGRKGRSEDEQGIVDCSPACLRSTDNKANPIASWVESNNWPESFFDRNMDRVLARKKSASSLRGRSRKRSQPGSASSVTPSDQKPREEKSARYRDVRYKEELKDNKSYMKDSDLGISDESKKLIKRLLHSEQKPPRDTSFSDTLFSRTCQSVVDRNETRINRDITPELVPSAEKLAHRGVHKLACLLESTNEGWSNSVPLTNPRPQPDYSVGFKREAFSSGQLEKMAPMIGNRIAGDQSKIMATYLIYFPFLSCEVKCGSTSLDEADRQNAHTATLAVRGVVELFLVVKREHEIDRKILAFSVSHDHRQVRLYGHYADFTGGEAKYYRHTIRTFDFTELDGKEKFTSYRFIKNVYEIWMPGHFSLICSAIDQLPAYPSLDVASLHESDLSRDLEGYNLSQSQSEIDPTNELENCQVDATPNTSFTVAGPAKKQRRRSAKG